MFLRTELTNTTKLSGRAYIVLKDSEVMFRGQDYNEAYNVYEENVLEYPLARCSILIILEGQELVQENTMKNNECYRKLYCEEFRVEREEKDEYDEYFDRVLICEVILEDCNKEY